MDIATVMAIVQTLLTAIQCSDQLIKFCSSFNYKSELESLERSLKTINAVLEDADAKQGALSCQDKLFIEELRDAVYDADDVLDEFFTLLKRKQLSGNCVKLSDKVRSFVSRFKPLALDMSRKVKNVRRKLDAIAANKSQFSIDVNDQPLRFRKEESCSYVYANDIIGRETDVENIVSKLLDPNVQRDLSFLPIVGIGGLGKTALAQLVFNDKRVTSAYASRFWACVSDEEQQKLNSTEILHKILESATGQKYDGCCKDYLQNKVRGELMGKKFLLVLDDVWNENRDEWMDLVGFLRGGKTGSWILVTTRSKETARIVGNGPMYELKGLSEKDSWRLFERSAFGPESRTDDLVSIGQDIVKKCAYVPLAIRAIGSLLYGQPRNKWLSFQEKGLANVGESEHKIKQILKLSFYNLKPALKSCFSYCAIFPKDLDIHKITMIRLWMAQGFIMPENGLDMEDVAEQYFMILLRRCFFQDVEKDKDGEIFSCKMHDLMHDIALEVAGNDIYIVRDAAVNVDKKVRHVNLLERDLVEFPWDGTHLRTCVEISYRYYYGPKKELPSTLFANGMHLRTLDLGRLSNMKRLPDSIGNLLHLRYLDLSRNEELEELPKTITKLYNLQTLFLWNCKGLKELPKDVSKLVNLSILDVSGCKKLTHIPSGVTELTGLHRLGLFLVGRSSAGVNNYFEELKNLKSLNSLKGSINIYIKVPRNVNYGKEDTRGGAYVRNKQHLTKIKFAFESGEGHRSSEYEEALLEQLQPHSNLKKLWLCGYHGVRMPRWLGDGNMTIHLPNLVRFVIQDCGELQWLPSLSKLPLLKILCLRRLPKVEYVETENLEIEAPGVSGSSRESASYFPSLQQLEILDLPKLKGWRPRPRTEVQNDHQVNFNGGQEQEVLWASSAYLAQLKSWKIWGCRGIQMTSIPWCPCLEKLSVEDCSESFDFPPKLRSLQLVSFIGKEKLPKGVEYCTSLQSLSIWNCPQLEALPTWMPNLTCLTKLQIWFCSKQLKERCRKSTGDDWPLIQHIPHIFILDVEEQIESLSDDDMWVEDEEEWSWYSG